MHAEDEKSLEQATTSKIFVSACSSVIAFLLIFDSIDGVVPLIQTYYSIGDSETALIGTTTSIAQTVTLALVWAFGDSFQRRRLFLASATIWIVMTLLSLFVGSETFMVFVIFRSLASSASTIFSVMIPVVLADLFKDRALGIALMCPQISEMAGGPIIGIISSWIVTSGVPWQTGVFTATTLSIVPLLALICTKRNIRNAQQKDNQRGLKRIFNSAFEIFSIKSYLLMSAMASFSIFLQAAYGFWSPTMYLLAWTNVPEIFFGLSYTVITAINSAAMLTGLTVGLPTILWFAQSWRHGTGPFSGLKANARAYPIVVALGFSLRAILFVARILVMDKSFVGTLIVSFFVGLGNATTGSLSQQMLLVIVPTHSRAAAVALYRFTSGIVATPAAQVIGIISDTLQGDSTLSNDHFRALQVAMLFCDLFLVITAICSFILIIFFPSDCEKAEVKEKEEDEGGALIHEDTSLLGKERSDSILETYVRSRTATATSGIFM